MEIRKCTVADMPELIALYQELVPWEHSVKCAEEIYRRMESDDHYFVLAADDGTRVLGTAMGICCLSLACGGKNFLVIEDVIVKEECRNMGIGKMLFHALDEYAVRHNCKYAILVSSGFRVGAHAFYEKMGFVEEVRGFRKGYEEYYPAVPSES